MTKPLRAVVVIGVTYIVGVSALYTRGLGIPAGYLTMPASNVVLYLTLLLAWIANASMLETAFGWTGNLVLLVLSATLNVVGVYLVVRRLSKK